MSRHARLKAKTEVKSKELVQALQCLVDELVRARPVQVLTSHCKLFFTDGACEPSSKPPGTIEGLLVDQWGDLVSLFGSGACPNFAVSISGIL